MMVQRYIIEKMTQKPVTAAILAAFVIAAGAFLLGALGATYYFNKETINENLARRFNVQPQRPDIVDLQWRTVATGLEPVEVAEFPLGRVDGQATGGAIEQFGDSLIYVSANGHIATIDLKSGRLAYSDVRVPMDYLKTLEEHLLEQTNFQTVWFRTLDTLVLERDAYTADLYVSHHKFLPETEDMCIVVSKTQITLGPNGPSVSDDWEPFFTTKQCVHLPDFNWGFSGNESGGRMIRFDDTHMLLSIGHMSLPKRGRPDLVDSPDTDFGKILKVNLATGETEHGPQGGDEVNLIRAGQDYGWPNMTLGTEYGPNYDQLAYSDAPLGRHPVSTMPAYAFVPSVGVSNLVPVTKGSGFEHWEGDLLVTSLRGETLFRLRPDGERIIYAEPIALGQRLRDIIALDGGGYAILAAASKNIILIRSPRAPWPTWLSENQISGYPSVRTLEGQVLGSLANYPWGRGLVKNNCGTCHSTAGENLVGPPLNGIVGSKIGARDYAYSEAFINARGKWTQSKLKKFIRNPQAMFPGAAMEGLSFDQLSERELDELVGYLAKETRPND